ncbi:site-specific integrase [Alicyclobacillus sp. SO9]|uniref:site-specific integrase n=1 Tax=Alicyclobacillus sp. SO9 TaxID=2665646 RepID=UPI0018E86D94|nr:site-specific integrase [Alicyclobacillus sp. SO9]QQE81076.1 site-specific integrase [Alicyclobacillus sp. SO9]
MGYVQPIRDKEKIEVMKQILKAGNPRDYCLFVLGINSGLRISDLLSLHVRDVLDDEGEVKSRIQLRERKTGKRKDFPVSMNAKRAIVEYLRERPECQPQEPLFLSRKLGGSICRQHAWTILNQAAKSAGIDEQIGTHTLRKTFGHQAYKAGVDITRIQKLLNHSSPFVTLAYIGITQDELDNIYMNLNL